MLPDLPYKEMQNLQIADPPKTTANHNVQTCTNVGCQRPRTFPRATQGQCTTCWNKRDKSITSKGEQP